MMRARKAIAAAENQSEGSRPQTERMPEIAVWSVDTVNGPTRATHSDIELEKFIETWIEMDPSLVEAGLTIVGRQLQTGAGPLDLLAIDPQGYWVIIEVKRRKMPRNAVTQALDYAFKIADMAADDLQKKIYKYLGTKSTEAKSLVARALAGASEARPVRAIVVGVGHDDRFQEFIWKLAKTANMRFSMVSFTSLQIGNQQRILLRQLTESDQPKERGASIETKISDLKKKAKSNGLGELFDQLVDTCKRLNFGLNPTSASLMIRNPNQASQGLVTVWAEPEKDGALKTYIWADRLAEWPGISKAIVQKELGGEGWHNVMPSQINSFASGLERILGLIEH